MAISFDELVAAGRAILDQKPLAPVRDPQTAGQFAADLRATESAFAKAIAEGTVGRPVASPPATSGDPVQDEINSLEGQINRLQSEILQMEEIIRPLKYSRQAATKAAERARIDLILTDLLPPYQTKASELDGLRQAHKNAMARRRSAAKTCANAIG